MNEHTLPAIRRITDFFDLSARFTPPDIPESLEWTWYRGQPADFRLTPGIYRQGFCGTRDIESDPAPEKERLRRENHLFQDFRVTSAGLLRDPGDPVAIYFLQQHYKMPTRLLDWTQSALVALYFAVSDQAERDAALYVVDTRKFLSKDDHRPAYKNFKGVADERNGIIKESVRVIDWFGNEKDFPTFIFPTRPDYQDARMAQQRSGFTFHVPAAPVLTREQNPTLSKSIIPNDCKRIIRRELLSVGVDEFFIFGDLEALARSLSLRYR